jgi:hypothetical protein
MSRFRCAIKRSIVGVAACGSLLLAAGVAHAVTPFQTDVSTAINNGLGYLASNGVFNASSSLGVNSAQGLAMEALLEKRASGNPSDPPQGYTGASAADQALLRSAATFILNNANQGFYAYRDGAWMMALSGYALSGGPDKSTLGTTYTIKQAMDLIVDRTILSQRTQANGYGATPAEQGYWCYNNGGCRDSSTTQFAAAGLNAARSFYNSNKSADDTFADPVRAPKIDNALALARQAYVLNAGTGSDNGNCFIVSPTERGHGYHSPLFEGYRPSMQQTASGVYIQLFGGADVNDPDVQHYMEWIKNHYRYSDLDSMGNSWPGPSYGYYLWSSFKGMELIRQSGVATNPGNIGPNEYGTLPAASGGCAVRQANIAPASVARPPLFGAGGVGYYSAETANQYFDYAYTLLAMQCPGGSFTCTGYPGSWGDAYNTSHNAYALLVLQRATGIVVQKCDVNGDGKVTTADLLMIRGKNGQKSSGPDDPADANGDGTINVADYRYCQLHLTP